MAEKYTTLLTGVLIYLASTSTWAAQIYMEEAESQAVIRAIDAFRTSKQTTDGYRILVRQHGEGIEVVLLPPSPLARDLFTDDLPSRPEIHYYTDITGTKVLRQLRGK